MAIRLDLDRAKQELLTVLSQAEHEEADSVPDHVPSEIADHLHTLVGSNTGAYRQALAGTILVRINHRDADLHLPAANLGEAAYNGRDIDEGVVMPIFSERRLPVSQSSAYLSTLRRGKRFLDVDAIGVQDRAAYLSTNRIIDWLQRADASESRDLLRSLLRAFIRMREEANVALADVTRLSLDQLSRITDGLLEAQSGGRFAMLITKSALVALSVTYQLNWTIEAQGINAADSQSGSAGDITVLKNGEQLLAIEVTERRVDGTRVRNAMNQKALPAGVRNYVYMLTISPADDARRVAQAFFGNGYDVNFLLIPDWIRSILALTAESRTNFASCLRAELTDMPAFMKVRWNTVVAEAI